MAKSNRATRKELETVIQEIIKELQYMRHAFNVLDNYLGAYVKFKGETILFNKFLESEAEKYKKDSEAKVNVPNEKDSKSAKQSRYQKIENPL
jgi:hypothetical protein